VAPGQFLRQRRNNLRIATALQQSARHIPLAARGSALDKEFFHVAVRQRETQVPANRQQDDLGFEFAAT